MRKAVVLLLIVVFMTVAYLLNRWLRNAIRPKESFQRLLLYMAGVLIMVFVLSFLMVLLITWLYPHELIA